MNKVAGETLANARVKAGKTQTEMANLLAESLNQGFSLRQYQKVEAGNFPKYKKEIVRKLDEILNTNLYTIVYEQNGHPSEEDFNHPYIRQPKTGPNPEHEGVLFVPIAAQANYAKSYTNPVYLNQLERVYIPGFPYRGERFRIFEVAGDSMEPTFKEGYHVVTEHIEPAFWNQIADFYIYVVVTENQVMLKRIFKKNEKEFVLISDNEEFHPQVMLPVEKVKELWLVKRKLDWEMSPPKRFEIKV